MESSEENIKIVTLATCHNRKEKTLASLNDLKSQVLPDNIIMQHVIVDDSSIDGTKEAIKSEYPDVEIIDGTGDLYWAGGMRHGWNVTVKYKDFDFLFVYNDDVRINEDAISKLLMTAEDFLHKSGNNKYIVVGSFLHTQYNAISYGGSVRVGKWDPLNFRPVEPSHTDIIEVDTMNMNACLISRSALEEIGFLAEYFIHKGADHEYGVRLKKQGGAVIAAPGYIGECDRNDNSPDEHKPFQHGLSYEIKNMLNVKNQPPIQRLRYYSEHGGFLWPILWLSPYMLLIYRWIKFKLCSR